MYNCTKIYGEKEIFLQILQYSSFFFQALCVCVCE